MLGGRPPLRVPVLTLPSAPGPSPSQSLALFSSETLLPFPMGLGELHRGRPGSGPAWLPLRPSGPPAQVQPQGRGQLLRLP